MIRSYTYDVKVFGDDGGKFACITVHLCALVRVFKLIIIKLGSYT